MEENIVYVGDTGTKLLFDIGIDSNEVKEAYLRVKNPNNEIVTWVASPVPNSTEIEYILKAQDLSVPGSWVIQPHITLASWSGYASKVTLDVNSPV